jgi:hypothetical protein
LRQGGGGPKLAGEQLVVDAKPALLLLGVGALDREEAFDEEALGPSLIPLPGAGGVALGGDAGTGGAGRLESRCPACWPRAGPAAVLLVVRAGLGGAKGSTR